MPNYPGSAPSFTSKSPGQTITSQGINDIADEVVAIGSALVGTITHALTTSNTVTSSGQPRCSAYATAAQSIATGAFTALSLGAETFDVGAMHDNATNNSRITVPAGGGGLYLIVGTCHFTANSTGHRAVTYYKNGAATGPQVIGTNTGASNAVSLQVMGLEVLAAGDYIQVLGFQASGGNLDVGSNDTTATNRLLLVKLW